MVAFNPSWCHNFGEWWLKRIFSVKFLNKLLSWKIQMQKNIIAISGVLSLALAGGCAMPTDQSRAPSVMVPQKQPTAQIESRDRVSGNAIVKSVNADKREVVVRGGSNKVFTLAVGEEVSNLATFKAGDPVRLSYYEALATSLDKNAARTAPSRREVAGTDANAATQTSAKSQGKEIEIVADITGIDKKTRQVKLLSGQNAVTLKVPESIDISTLKAGNQVKATYLQEIATSIELASIAKKRKK